MANIDIDAVWAKGKIIDGKDPDKWRLDCCGALIFKDNFGDRSTQFGWEVDHVIPRSLLKEKGISEDEIDHPDNLRPIQWKNNVAKGNDYPVYKSSMLCKGDINIESDGYYEVNKNLQRQLNVLFQKYGI